MAWRGLHLTRPSRRSLADGQIIVSQDDGEVRLAVEDVAWVILDTPQSTLTGSLLAACMSAGIAVIVTDETHTPAGVTLPFHRHFFTRLSSTHITRKFHFWLQLNSGGITGERIC